MTSWPHTEIKTSTNFLATFRCTYLAGAPETWPISPLSSLVSSCHMMTSVPTHVECPNSAYCQSEKTSPSSKESNVKELIPKKEITKKVCQQRKCQRKFRRKCQSLSKKQLNINLVSLSSYILCQVKLFFTILIVLLQAVDHVARCHALQDHVVAYRDELLAVSLLPQLPTMSRL